MDRIGIIDCGMGNLTSVKNAFLLACSDCSLIRTPSEIEDFDKIVLPGVGAFPAMMQKLTDRKFEKYILRHIANDKPFMGICLGMQVLFERSYEFEETEGLSILKGEVIKLPIGSSSVPNVGWWELKGDFGSFNHTLSKEDTFYFVHSYFCNATTPYSSLKIEVNGVQVLAGIRYNNIFAYQFHPEKSQRSGQKLIKSFVSM
jgi:glutamine amidotransferase